MSTDQIQLVSLPNFNPDLYQDNEEDDEIQQSSVSCDTIRKKITMFLATKEMTQTAFLAAIGGVNSNSYGRFMKLKGRDSGRENGTYWGAVNFFHRRDKEQKEAKKQAKLAEKGEKKKRTASDIADGQDAGANKSAKLGHEPTVPLVSVDLPEELPVFDDCDEVRTKIAQCIQSPGMNQSKFAKSIGLTPAAVTKFLAKKGFNQGAGSDVYANAYRYFEKVRLESGLPKSAHRVKNEAKHPEGFSLRNAPTHEWVFMG